MTASPRGRRPGRRRSASRTARRAAVVLAALLPLVVPVLPAGGHLQPAAAQPEPTPTRPADDDAAGEPVQVEVEALLPRAPTRADEPLQVTGRLVNGGDRTVSDLTVRLLVGGRVDSRSALARADADPVPGRPRGLAAEVPGELEPGASVPFDLRLEVGDLGLQRLGVYPVQVQARGLLDGDRRADAVGAASTFVPWFPEERPRPTRLAFLLPLVTQPERAPDGALLGDRTRTEVADDGRLAQLLEAGRTGARGACDVPASPAPDAAPGPAATPAPPCRGEAVPVTWAADPDLLETVQALAGEHVVVEGVDPLGPREARPGDPAAARWLDDLRAAVGGTPREGAAQAPGRPADVVALPFADPDVVPVARAETGLAGDLEQLRLLGVRTLTDVLGTEPLETVAWPPAGPLPPAGLDAVAATGARAVVLDPVALPPSAPTLSRTPGARTQLTSTVSGRIDALVVDEGLSELLTAGPQDPDWQGDRLAEQRWLVETAIITAERPETRTLLVAPPRRAQVRSAVLSGALLDAGRLPWLCPVPLAAVVLHTEACGLEDPEAPPEREEDLGELRSSVDDAEQLPADYLVQVASVRARAEQLTDQVLVAGTDPAAQTRSRLLRARGRTLSSAWRDEPGTGRTLLALQRAEVDRLRAQVQLVTSGRVLLTSDTGVVEVGLSNALDQPVVVGVALNDPVEARLTSTDTGVQTVGPGQQVQVRVRVEARVSGQFVVRATLLDQAGRPFGEPVELVARSTRYGRLALAVTGVAFAVLLVAVGVRLYRRAVRAAAPAELHD